jgi:hypothetical protein
MNRNDKNLTGTTTKKNIKKKKKRLFANVFCDVGQTPKNSVCWPEPDVYRVELSLET